MKVKPPAHLRAFSMRDKEQWTAAEDDKMLEMRDNKVPYVKIARALQREYKTIAARMTYVTRKRKGL